jgi:dnd system-associated protein 4
VERRVRIPKDKDAFISRLTRSDEYPNGPFRLRADVINFAAVYGYSKKARRPFEEAVDPIRAEVFERQGYATVMYLLAIAETGDPAILAETDVALDRRTTIYEEYASGGLELLASEFEGLNDPLDRLALLVSEQKSHGTDSREDEFDLSRFLQ